MDKMLKYKKDELEMLEGRALRIMNYIQSIDTPRELALFGKDKMMELVEVQTLINKVNEDIRMIEYFKNGGK